MIIDRFDTDKDVFIIAEVGNNHEGSVSLAEELIGQAAKSGAHAVKFQTIVPERLVSSSQRERIEQLKKFQLSYSDFERLKRCADAENITFLSTPFDIESALFLRKLVPAYKIASGDNNFFKLIEVIAKTGKPVLLSSGLMDMGEIFEVRDFIKGVWEKNGISQDMAILHCVSSYPVPESESNVFAIGKLCQELDTTVGYSDHTMGIEACVKAVALGARIIEKHFTISKDYSDFRDHKISADPQEFKDMASRVSEAESISASEDKRIQNCEKDIASALRRSIAAGRDLVDGQVIEASDITWLRPGTGIPCGSEDKVVGRTLKRQLKQGEIILEEDMV